MTNTKKWRECTIHWNGLSRQGEYVIGHNWPKLEKGAIMLTVPFIERAAFEHSEKMYLELWEQTHEVMNEQGVRLTQLKGRIEYLEDIKEPKLPPDWPHELSKANVELAEESRQKSEEIAELKAKLNKHCADPADPTDHCPLCALEKKNEAQAQEIEDLRYQLKEESEKK